MMSDFSPMQQIKRGLYAMRNGVVADALRRGGCPCRYIFGLNLPQLSELATQIGKDADLSLELRADSLCRESMLLSAMTYPIEGLGKDEAYNFVHAIRWAEDADIICFQLLRHSPYALDIARDLAGSEERLHRYTALRLYSFLIAKYPREALSAAQAELNRPDALTTLAGPIIQESEI